MVLVIFESKESEKTMTIQTKMLKKPLSLDKGGGYGKSSISLGALDLLGFLRIFPLPLPVQPPGATSYHTCGRPTTVAASRMLMLMAML